MSLTDLTGVTIDDLIGFIITTKENTDNFDWMDYPITVAFKDRDGMTVLSDITSVCFNGKSIQLNEEEFGCLADTPLLLEEVKRLREQFKLAYDWVDYQFPDGGMQDFAKYIGDEEE